MASQKSQSCHDVVVVGGGIAGLSAAFRLQQRGLSVLVLDADDVVGGKMSSLRRDGWTINRGSTLLPSSYAALRRLIIDSGGPNLSTMAANVGIPRDGTMHTLRVHPLAGLLDGVRTNLISHCSKLALQNLVLDAIRMRRTLTYDNVDAAAEFDTESLGEYVARQLNRELGDWVIGPLLRGIFLFEPEQMSVVDLVFTTTKLLAGGLLDYPVGIDFVTRRLAETVDLHLGARVDVVEKIKDAVEVTWHQDGLEQTVTVSGVVVAVSGKDVDAIYPQLDPVQCDILRKFQYTAITKAVFALDEPVDAPTVIAVPREESEGLGVICYDSRSMPGSAPPGKAMLSAHWMTDWTRRHLDIDDDDLVPRLVPDMEWVLPGISDKLNFVHLQRWPNAALAPGKGVYQAVRELRARIDPDDRVQLAGDYFGQSGLNLSATAGEQAAARLAQAMRA